MLDYCGTSGGEDYYGGDASYDRRSGGGLKISTENIIIPLGTTTSVDIEIFNGLGIMVLK